MTFTDAVRQLLHDPIRLGAIRSSSGMAPIMPMSGRGFLSLLTDGRLVWKTEHGQRMEAYTASAQDVLAEDWEVADLVPVPTPPAPPPSTLGVERYAKGDFRTTPGQPPKPPTGPFGQAGVAPSGSVVRHGPGGASPPVGGQGPARGGTP